MRTFQIVIVINILPLHYSRRTDDPNDLCVHGAINVKTGDKVIVNETDGNRWTLSAAALNFMRTLGGDHETGDLYGQLIPCCGFAMYPAEDVETVDIVGCGNGFDWTIRHRNNEVIHIADRGEQGSISAAEYRQKVMHIAEAVERFYNTSAPKVMSEDQYDEEGYESFWREWRTLKQKWL